MMKNISLFLFFCLISANSLSQVAIHEHTKQKINRLIEYHFFMLNSLGDQETMNEEKEVMINESYLKVFVNNKVQIEDDLDPTRSVITNKDIQAYLKDVEFFFNYVVFSYRIDKITKLTKSAKIIYKVQLERHIKGATIKDEVIDNKIEQFFEINVLPESGEMRIASIYSEKITLEEEYSFWWNKLSEVWKSILRKKCGFYKEPTEIDLNNIADIDSLNLKNHYLIENLKPLEKLHELKFLDISNTSLQNVYALRYCSNLEILKAANTTIRDFSILRFSNTLREIDLSNNKIIDYSFLSSLSKLHTLNLSNSNFNMYDTLKELPKLENLILNQLDIRYLGQLPKLPKLKFLSVMGNKLLDLENVDNFISLVKMDFSDNRILESKELAQNKNLEFINANNTFLNDFDGFINLKKLKKIEFDADDVDKNQIITFINKRPDVEVLFNTDELKNWWIDLHQQMQNYFIKKYNLNSSPSKENLNKIAKIKFLNFSKLKSLSKLDFLYPFYNLEKLDISETSVKDLKPLRNTNIKSLIMKGLIISDFKDIENIYTLEYLDISNGRLISTEFLSIPKQLFEININNTIINPKIKKQMLFDYPDKLWIDNVKELESWWFKLSENWKIIFKEAADLPIKNPINKKDLSRIQMTDSILIDRINIVELNPLSKIRNLKYLDIRGKNIHNIAILSQLDQIEFLNISQNPITSLRPLLGLSKLKILNISNTSIGNLEDLATHFSIEELDISGNSIKDLSALKLLNRLKSINLSNTMVKSLKNLYFLPSLENLICFNTKIKEKNILQFQLQKPKVKIVYD